MTTNDQLFERARQAIPGGVNSPVRAYGSVGGTPRFLVSASGATVTDAEGRDYVDLVGSWGPAILGHAHPEVVAAVQEAAARGLSFGATTPPRPSWPNWSSNACRPRGSPRWSACDSSRRAPRRR